MAGTANDTNEVKDIGEFRFYLGIEAEIIQGQDLKDVESATNIWLTWVGEQWGVKAKSTIYNDLDSITDDFIRGKIDLIVLTSLDYLKLIHHLNEEPELGPTGVLNGDVCVKYLLIVRKDLNYTHISDLRGKKLAIQAVGDIERLFVNTLLLRAGLKETPLFFSEVIEKTKPSRAILDVFFGQSDVCVVPENVFNTMIELNPQIGRQTKILAASPAVLPTVTGFRKSCDPRVKKFILNQVPLLQNSEKGKQLFLMYKIEDIAQIQNTDLDTLRAMVLEYDTLKAKLKTNEN
jgi:ABC-type phosphate/phosphonate transport system substrate-binding protein